MMFMNPTKATVYVSEANETLVFYIKDADTLHELWKATKYTEINTGRFVNGWMYVGKDPDVMDSAEKGYWSINVANISNVKWELSEV